MTVRARMRARRVTWIARRSKRGAESGFVLAIAHLICDSWCRYAQAEIVVLVVLVGVGGVYLVKTVEPVELIEMVKATTA